MKQWLIILLFPAVLWAGPRIYVHGPADLEAHFRLHIERVKRLGLSLYDSHPEAFPGVSRQEVWGFLSVHDLAKFNRLGALYSIYGVGYHPDTDELRGRVEEIVAGVNEADRRIRETFLRGFSDDAVHSLTRVERIADVVDRNTDPVAREEFAMVPGKEPPLSAFLRNADLGLARELQAQYGTLVAGFAYRRCPFAALRN